MKSIKLPAALLLSLTLLAQNQPTEIPSQRAIATAQLSQDQIRALIRQVADKDIENDKKQNQYTYIQREEEHKLDPESLIQVYFVLQIAFRRPAKLPGIVVQPFGYREGQSVMPVDRTKLTMTLNETPSGIIGSCSYKSDLHKQRWVEDYCAIIAAAAASPGQRLARFADRLKTRSPM